MKKVVLNLIAGVLFIVAAFNALGQEKAEAPTYKDGEFWQFKVTEKDFQAYSSEALDGIYELSYSQGKVKGYKLTGDQKEDIELRSNHPTDQLLVLLGSSQKRQDLKFPLAVGQKWNYEYKDRPRGARREQTRSVEIRVVGIEQVSTPAGTFRALKMEKEESWVRGRGAGGGVARRVTTYFYSPEVKSILKSSWSYNEGPGVREIELVKFGSAR